MNVMVMKKVLLYVILISFVYLTIEILSFVTFYLVKGESFSLSGYQEKRAEITDSVKLRDIVEAKDAGSRREQNKLEVIHPYLGFVIDPKTIAGTSMYGFRGTGPTPPIIADNTDEVVIGIFGGSFAEGTTKGVIQPALIEQLQALPQ